MALTFPLVLEGGARLSAVEVGEHEAASLGPTLREAGVPSDVPVLVVVGGAGGMGPDEILRLRATFDDVVAMLEVRRAAAVDGGTHAGVMRLLGEARREGAATFPLVGVAAAGTLALPGRPRPDGAADVDPGHSHLIVVPGDRWGDESPWIARVATAVAHRSPSVTLLVNGGEIAYTDVANSLREQRHVVAVDGSGRAADDLAAAVRGDAAAPSRARELASSGLVTVADLTEPGAVARSLSRHLGH